MANPQLTTEIEIWKPIPGFPGYEVSDQGRVRSFLRRYCLGRGKGFGTMLAETPQRILQPHESAKGYLGVALRKHDKTKYFFVHYLLLTTFIGPRPPDMWACHYDGNPRNNVKTNLRWDTPANNGMDTRRHGSMKGVKNHSAKLTDTQVVQIRELAAQACSQKDIGVKFGISQPNVSEIVGRKIWAHVP